MSEKPQFEEEAGMEAENSPVHSTNPVEEAKAKVKEGRSLTIVGAKSGQGKKRQGLPHEYEDQDPLAPPGPTLPKPLRRPPEPTGEEKGSTEEGVEHREAQKVLGGHLGETVKNVVLEVRKERSKAVRRRTEEVVQEGAIAERPEGEASAKKGSRPRRSNRSSVRTSGTTRVGQRGNAFEKKGRILDEFRKQVLNKGKSRAEAAKDAGVVDLTLRRWEKEAGLVPATSRSDSSKRSEILEKFRSLVLREGITRAAAAKQLGLTDMSVRRWEVESGLRPASSRSLGGRGGEGRQEKAPRGKARRGSEAWRGLEAADDLFRILLPGGFVIECRTPRDLAEVALALKGAWKRR
jgi:DNA-binding XRE family transcriptional regulator